MNRQSVINRVLLGLAGLVLLGGGLLVLAGGFDIYNRWHLTPPAGWPLTSSHTVLLTTADRTRWSDEGWWWPVVIAALSVLVLLALWWLLSQLRAPRPGQTAIGGTHPADGVELNDRALSDALAADARQLPGVQEAHVRMTGRPSHPRSRINLTIAPDSQPGPILQALSEGPLTRARQATGWTQLPTQTRLQTRHRKPHRAE
ncbi:alkaline shock response membrane anchor protein AmaP [Streptomyces sp. NPDC095817]|uniref:alkaline shock response membrane anchor protein AmaP n=1 Tax=Streptomyces sp. NPDC095817 TaxID=3155082 RepID=UPI0033322B30